MQVVRTLALVAALCSACVVAAQDANSPPPPATNINNNAPAPTTVAPSSTPAPSTTAPSATTPRPAAGVGPVANVTTDTTGTSATVQISSRYDSVEVDIVAGKTNVKSTDAATDASISTDTKQKMTVLVSTGTSMLQFQTLTSEVVSVLEIRSDDDQRETSLRLPANGFAGLSKLSSLSFQSVKFYKPTVNMTVPASLAYLKIDRSNVADIGLYGSEAPDAVNLNKVEFSNSGFSSLPFLFYQRSYSSSIDVVSMNLISGVTKLSMEEYTNARHNLGNSTLLSFNPSCDNVTSPSVTDFDKAHVVCRDPKLAGIRALGQSNEVLNPTAGPSVAPTPTPTHRGSNSNTTLTVVVVVIAVVAAILAYFVARRYFCTATSSLSRSPRLNERMIAKDETQGNNNKLSFISSDDALRQIRLEQQDVSVTKSVGTGRLWVGDYAGRKVMIKRIEAESSDSYATKALITQARSLAGLSHPNIVSLVGVTWVQGTDFGVVSEFMEKGTLKSVLMDLDADFDLQSKLHMCLDIAQALKYLHSSTHNMYMRRLTSRKVLVNGAIECKLNLFECHPCTTKIEYPEVFGAGELAWQAPELITRTGVLDPRKINMFSLGVLMGEILTRVSPYQSAVDAVGHTLADLDLVKRIRRQERLMPHENRREFTDLPSALRDMVERCLSYQPLSRPTADDVVQCLESVKNYSERVGSTTSL